MRLKKTLVFVLSITLAVSTFSVFPSYDFASAQLWDNPEVQGQRTEPYTVPAGAAQEQMLVTPGTSVSEINPGAYIFQRDAGDWRIQTYRNGQGETESFLAREGPWDAPYPAKGTIANKVDSRSEVYQPGTGFELAPGDPRVNPNRMINKAITKVESDDSSVFSRINDVQFLKPHIYLMAEIGGMPDSGGYIPIQDLTPFSPPQNIPGTSWQKHSLGYRTPATLHWRGDYTEKKLIDIEGQSTMAMNATQQLKSPIKTAPAQSDGSGGVKYDYPATGTDVATRAGETTWAVVSGSSVDISGTGMVTAKANGTTTVKVTWKKDLWQLTKTFQITVGGTPPPPPPPPTGGCAAPTKTASMKSPASAMQPNVTGKVKADVRDAEKFNVALGIPVLESLFANVMSKIYLFDYEFGKYEGECTYQISVSKTYNLSWTMDEPSGTDSNGNTTYRRVTYRSTEPRTKTYTVKRPYSYWALDKYDSYKIKNATATNYALPGGSISITPEGYNPPTSDSDKLPGWRDHVQDPPSQGNKTLPNQPVGTPHGGPPSVPDEDWTSVAEGQVGRSTVWNDKLNFGGSVIMNPVRQQNSTPAPGAIPASGVIGQNVLYKPNQMISKEKLNGHNYPTTGNIYYEVLDSVESPGTKTYPITDYNTITIHTPVVNYSDIPETNRPFDQSVVPDFSRIPLLLGRDFFLNFPNTGQHVTYPGYGNRDYTKYVGEKRIQFPFDVYAEGTFYAARTWIPLSITGVQTKFRLPEWVDEGNYTVRTESWAVNAPSRDTNLTDHNYNRVLEDYAAYETYEVEVIGRVYGFRVHDVGDLRFENVFRISKGSAAWTGFQYYSGGKDKDGFPNDVYGKATKMLPVRPGSHPTQVATTPHNGYPFLFYFNTIGNVWNANEGVKIEPEFYYVPKDGKKAAILVDLYYNETNKKFVKVGSAEDKKTFQRVIKLGDPMRNVDSSFLDYMARFEYQNFWTAAAKSKTTLTKFLSQVKDRKTQIASGYKDMTLNYQMRTLIGKVDSAISVPEETQTRAVQRWFGEYNLPIAPYVLPKGTNLEQLTRTKYKGSITGKESEFLKKGYITVNFKITTFRNGQPNTEILAYDAKRAGGVANMWQIESQVRSSTSYLGAEFDFNYGDIAMFESDFSVRDDFRNTGR